MKMQASRQTWSDDNCPKRYAWVCRACTSETITARMALCSNGHFLADHIAGEERPGEGEGRKKKFNGGKSRGRKKKTLGEKKQQQGKEEEGKTRTRSRRRGRSVLGVLGVRVFAF